ncbi:MULTISPECIES: PQQ-binding-like beta-propeller repeat protein [unclassified Spiroplasma]|uniref:PQQ-binding-like beta-propeller repeat protein n=1 Tax=unclassified Spiroplasma TaxID=2637901 RepID=UPI00313F2085
MKKLLSLLSTITIASSGISGIVANSPYQKQQIKLENINYKRQKRNDNENNKINIAKIVIHSKGGIRCPGIVLNNKLYFCSIDNNIYEYDPATEQQKIVITTGGVVTSSGVVLKNKVYFGSRDHNFYEYDPATNQQKIVIKTNGWIGSSGIVLNNKLYVGSWDGNVYEYDPATEQQKNVIKTNGWIFSSGVILNNKLYIGSYDNNVYEYDPATNQQKIVITSDERFSESGVVLNNKVYFGSLNYNFYEYDPTTGQQKIIIRANFNFSDGVILNNKLYVGSWDGNVYEYDPITEQQKIVIRANNKINVKGVILNNKLYVGSWDGNVYEYDPATNQQKIVIKTNGWIGSSGVTLNNKVYFGSWDNNVYEYNPATGQQKIIIKTNGLIYSPGVVFNNKIYFGSDDHNVYEYNDYYWDLGQINVNSDTTILNELNFLDPYLDISKLEIIDKTNNSATIKAKNNNNKYFVKNKVYYSVDQQNKIINLNELIKKATLFKFRDENSNLKFKQINYININNLNFENVEVTRDSKLLHKTNFKEVCFKKKERINNSPVKKIVKIPACNYNQKSKFMFQTIKGIGKYGQENTKNDWTLNIDDENKLINFVNINYRDEIITNILSNDFDLSKTNKQEREMVLVFIDHEDEIELAPHEKAIIKYSVREINLETTLNLKQKINGNITATVINVGGENKNFTISIKEAMQILQEHSLLPDEITINEDNNITFNGKAKISLIQEAEPKLIINTSIV